MTSQTCSLLSGFFISMWIFGYFCSSLRLVLMTYLWTWLAKEQSSSLWGRCLRMHQDEFDAVPLGAEEFHHEIGRLNTLTPGHSNSQTKYSQCFAELCNHIVYDVKWQHHRLLLLTEGTHSFRICLILTLYISENACLNSSCGIVSLAQVGLVTDIKGKCWGHVSWVPVSLWCWHRKLK